jgi:hypothetical protein
MNKSRGLLNFSLLPFCSVLLAALPAYSQIVSIGAKVGVPLTSADSAGAVPDGAASASQDHFVIGPTAEVHLPLQLSLEVDALYRRYSFGVRGNELGGGFNINSTVNDWQVPFLLKYEIKPSGGVLRPFLDTGIAYRHVTSSNTGQSVAATNPNTVGYAVGGGVTLKLPHLRISPEFRFTQWSKASFDIPFITNQKSQADLLVGFTF